MKSEDVAPGTYDVGDFRFVIARCVFDRTPVASAAFFEVLLCEVQGARHYYVNLHEDPRFAYFSWVGKFETKMIESDVVEHNAYVDALFVKLAQPTWKLHRQSIARLFRHCDELTRAATTRRKKDRHG